MKKSIAGILLLLLLSALVVNAQSTENNKAASIVEQMPEYPGGMDSLIREVSAKIVYPQICRDSNIQGKVYVRFIVNEDGSISDIEAKAPHPLLKAAAIDAIKTIGKFKPGMDKGKAVKVWYNVPLSFKLKQMPSLAVAAIEKLPVDIPKPDKSGSENLEALDAEGKIVLDKRTGVFYSPEVPPRCAYGDDFLGSYIWKSIRYPKWEESKHIGGEVVARFVVDEQGKISDIQLIKSVSPGIDSEMLRVMRILPKFYPGRNGGKPIKAYYQIPYTFLSDVITGSKEWGATVWDFYPGGLKAFERLIKDSLHYPSNGVINKMEANILIKCKLNDTLKLVPVKVVNDFVKEFTDEALRLIKQAETFRKGIRKADFWNEEQVIKIEFRLPQANESSGPNTRLSKDYYESGFSNFKKADYTTALSEFNEAIKASSINADAYYNRGITKLKLNDSTGACDDFERAYLLGELDALKGIKQACK